MEAVDRKRLGTRDSTCLLVRQIVLAAVLCLSLAGCVSQRPAASTLASRGSAAAATVQAALSAYQEDLETYTERRAVHSRLTGRDDLSAQALSQIELVRSAYAARAMMLGDVVKLYASFGKLAAYDAAEEVEAGLNNLFASVNEFAKSIGEPTAPVSSAMSDAIGKVGAAIATADQNRRIRASSEAIRLSLKEVRRLLESEQRIHASVRQTLSQNAGDAALALSQQGIGLPHPILRKALGNDDFTYDEAAGKTKWNSVKELQDAVKIIVQRRAERRATAQASAFRASVAALEELESAHEAIENNQSMDLEALTQQLQAIRIFIDAINPSSDKEAK